MDENELSQKTHFGDVRDMSQDIQEGITLERYAELAVAMRKPGIDAEATARQLGLTDTAHWTRIDAAWAEAIAKDTESTLSTQFDALYQKYAGPPLPEEQVLASAATLSESNQPGDRVGEPAVPEASAVASGAPPKSGGLARLALPLVAALVIVGGVIVFFMMKSGAPDVNPSAAAPAESPAVAAADTPADAAPAGVPGKRRHRRRKAP